MRIYVASSWRNDWQPTIVRILRMNGHQVYDFKNPSWNDKGFHWSEIGREWKDWTFEQYLEGLDHPLAENGYKSDMDAMEASEVCVLVLPCGRSAHLELGWFCGMGKPTCILHPPMEPLEPELMAKMAEMQTNDTDEVIDWLATMDDASEQIWGRGLQHCDRHLSLDPLCPDCNSLYPV